MKNLKMIVLTLCFQFICTMFSSADGGAKVRIPRNFNSLKEQLVEFKDGALKVFFGGPIVRPGVKLWARPAVFEDKNFKVKSVYEIVFVNCEPTDTRNAPIFYIEARDIDLKLRNEYNDTYKIFEKLLSGKFDRSGRYVIVRKSDVSMITYPDVFVDFQAKSMNTEEMNRVFKYLAEKSNTRKNATILSTFPEHKNIVAKDNSDMTIFLSERILTNFRGKPFVLFVDKVYLKNDKWKLYYIVRNEKICNLHSSVKVRMDSGCEGGQVYDDDACDCMDQFFDFINYAKNNWLIVHIPAHDGRGFGFAPKAETEIYKAGGKGRIHTVNAMDTVSAAKLLYQVSDDSYDIRDYDGCAKIFKLLGVSKISMFTDNVRKLNSLSSAGISVSRVPTGTHKASCLGHILAKKADNALYYKK